MAETYSNVGGSLDLVMHPGATFYIDLVLTDGDGDPIDLTGSTLRLLAATPDGTEVLDLTSDPAAGIEVTDADAGAVALTVEPDDVPAVGTVTRYSLSRTDSEGFVECLTRGTVRVTFGPPAGEDS